MRRKADRAGVRGWIAERQQRGERVDVGARRVGQWRGQDPAQVRLVDVTGRDVLAHAAETPAVYAARSRESSHSARPRP
jgi:hypothetical protein